MPTRKQPIRQPVIPSGKTTSKLRAAGKRFATAARPLTRRQRKAAAKANRARVAAAPTAAGQYRIDGMISGSTPTGPSIGPWRIESASFLSSMVKAMEALGCRLNDAECRAVASNFGHCPATVQALRTGSHDQLLRALEGAWQQAVAGKGLARHATAGQPFLDQPIHWLGRQCGIGFLVGQATKKAIEAQRLTGDAARRELLGAIVYLAAACHHVAPDPVNQCPAAPTPPAAKA